LIQTAAALAGEGRTTVSLDGAWQVAEGRLDVRPEKFDHSVPVPGLLDQAVPAFESPGATVPVEKRGEIHWPDDSRREAFWYRRTFTVDEAVPAVAVLKVGKATYGTKVWLNGRAVGEHMPCFTSGYFDLKPVLKGNGQQNELVIRVGSAPAALPHSVMNGYDFEKCRYIPGIYDSVELILSGTPNVANVQAVPLLEQKAVRVVAEIANTGGANTTAPVKCSVREAKSGREVGQAETHSMTPDADGKSKIDVTIPIRDAHAWTPEDPFLYELVVDTGADRYTTRFGLRSFRFDPSSGHAVLNGKPYFLRGSNVCIFRFFEDPQRGSLPWDETWVRNLHRKFKEMHWNSLRYCIGFPPEAWYRIADEEGILIDDEAPIWMSGFGKVPPMLTVDSLAAEFTEWMRERWNHPCVVIWDAENETVNCPTSKVIPLVRNLDLSNRPWDNGWSEPQSPGDMVECHPYREHNFTRWKGLESFLQENPRPNPDHWDVWKKNGFFKDAPPPNARVIDEYGSLWMNRDGSDTQIGKGNLERLLGKNASAAERWNCYARILAAETEFWRGHRGVAGVLEFCGLGYSRPGGFTSDNFIDVAKLDFEPEFYKYVRDAFSPVGVMVDSWKAAYPSGPLDIPVIVINDLDSRWQGKLNFQLIHENKVLQEKELPCEVEAFGKLELHFPVEVPAQAGKYLLRACLKKEGEEPVCSLRDFEVRKPLKTVLASSNLDQDGATAPEAAVDDDPKTRWSSAFSDPQWIAVDLGKEEKISRVELDWESAAKAYTIDVSADGKNWHTVYQTEDGHGGKEVIPLLPTNARWVRMMGLKRATRYGYSLWEMRILQ